MKINDLVRKRPKQLNEVLQMEKAADWEWNRNPILFSAEAIFKINGIKYLVGFSRSPFGESMDAWMTGFAVDTEQGATLRDRFKEDMFGSGGNELKVFRTAMDIVADFIRKRNPEEMHIGAVPRRERIYSRILKKFEPEIEKGGYRIAEPEYTVFPPYGRVVIFSLERK